MLHLMAARAIPLSAAWMGEPLRAISMLELVMFLIPPLQKLQGRDWLGFAEIPTAEVRLISKEQQVAEKLHAYGLPRSTPNSRVKDLVDLLLLVRSREARQDQLVEAVRMTFDRRKTHAIPSALVPPPESWEGQFRGLATECRIASGMSDSIWDER